MSQAKFDAIRSRYVTAGERRDKFQYDVLLRKYGKVSPPQSWMTKGECAKLDAFDRAQSRAMDRMFDLLDEVSPRYWRSGVAAWWVMERLSWGDAITAGALGVIPQTGYGSTVVDVERFAAAVAV